MIFVTAASCVQHSASAKGKIGVFFALSSYRVRGEGLKRGGEISQGQGGKQKELAKDVPFRGILQKQLSLIFAYFSYDNVLRGEFGGGRPCAARYVSLSLLPVGRWVGGRSPRKGGRRAASKESDHQTTFN